MKHLISLFVLCFFATGSYSNKQLWKWQASSARQWRQSISRVMEELIIPCREPEKKYMGVVNKNTGYCILLSRNKEIELYDIFSQPVSDYFHWVDQEQADCYWELSSSSELETMGRSENCAVAVERLCRHYYNEKWVPGLTDKYGCVGFPGGRVMTYQLFVYNYRKYKPLIFVQTLDTTPFSLDNLHFQPFLKLFLRLIDEFALYLREKARQKEIHQSTGQVNPEQKKKQTK